jgi:hypothetical protein
MIASVRAVVLAFVTTTLGGAMAEGVLGEPTPVETNPRELGRVRWGRDLDAALAESRASGRPVALLFDEVPGCATCVGFGESVLSHELIVEALETEFVPLFVHNNKAGESAEILARFGEPAWNNPVVRFVDASGRDVIARRDGIYSAPLLASRMANALHAAGRETPRYLALVAQEVGAASAATATFAMHCFWAGEACLGAIDGVTATRAGFLDSREIVEVTFDPERLAYDTLLREAAATRCADLVFAHDEGQAASARHVFGERMRRTDAHAADAPAADQKYHLAHSELARLDLTPIQEARINAALSRGDDVREWLSPRQILRASALARESR